MALWITLRALVASDDRARVGAVVALGFAMHVAVAVVLYTGALAAGRGGFIPGDDGAYARLADAFVGYLQGTPNPDMVPPGWGGHLYLFGTWVYLESAIFFVVGPEVLVPILLNGALAVGTALLAYDMARRLFDRRAAFLALLLVTFYPSLVLWSSLNLKDALALGLIGLALWALVRFQMRPRWWLLVLAFAVLVPMESLRRYLFVGLTLLIPVAVAITPRLTFAMRARWTFGAAVASAIFLIATEAGAGLGPQLLDTFEFSRQKMGVGARTRIVEAAPVSVKDGDTFVVATPPATVATEDPGQTPTTSAPPSPAPTAETPATSAPPTPAATAETAPVVHVAPNARIVVVTGSPPVVVAPDPPISPKPGRPTPAQATGEVFVRPGTIIVVGPPETSPAPAALRMSIDSKAPAVQLVSEEERTEVAVRTIAYLPTGLAFALFAPFPWQVRRAVELATLPDMLLWYTALVAAAVTLVRQHARWQRLFALGGLAAGVLLLLALVEGNVGTLYRHRAMSIPWVLLLAAPTLAPTLEALGRGLRNESWDRARGSAEQP